MKYKKKRVEVEAMEFTGRNYKLLDSFVKSERKSLTEGPYRLKTKTGIRRAYPGDMIIKDKEGVFHVSDAVDFNNEYEEILGGM